MARRRSNPLTNYALMNDILARQRANEREAAYDLREAERNGYPVEERREYGTYTATEYALLRKAMDPSLGEQSHKDAIYEALAAEHGTTGLDFFKDDLFDHLRALRYSIALYLRSPLIAVLSVLMLAGHAAILVFAVSIGMSNEPGNTGFGSPVFNAIIAGWSIYNVAALTFVAISPLLLTSLSQGIWRLVGGKSHTVVQFLMVSSALPAMGCGALLIFGQSDPNPLVIAMFFSHAVLPLVIRKVTAMSLRKQIRKLSIKVSVMADAVG